MNKIVLQVGLLVFFLGMIFFAQRGLPVEQVILRSFMVFIFVTIMLAIISILVIKSINKALYKKKDELAENLSGK
jgi:positive regulator of sigma E activity